MFFYYLCEFVDNLKFEYFVLVFCTFLCICDFCIAYLYVI